MTQFIFNYVSSLTGFAFERPVIERIIAERNLVDISEASELTQKDRDLVMADLLYTAFFSPSQTASLSKKHGTFSVTVGSQYITNRGSLYREMMRLYKKWEDPRMEGASEGVLQWME